MPLKKAVSILLGLGLLLSHTLSIYAASSIEEQTVLASLALNIVRFTTRPPETQAQMKNSIAFCVVGYNVVQESFTTIDNKAVGDKTLHVINLSRVRNFEQCHVLYINELKQNALLQVSLETKNHPQPSFAVIFHPS